MERMKRKSYRIKGEDKKKAKHQEKEPMSRERLIEMHEELDRSLNMMSAIIARALAKREVL